MLCVFLIGGAQVIKGDLSIGNFVAINSYFSIALGSISFSWPWPVFSLRGGSGFPEDQGFNESTTGERRYGNIWRDIEHISVKDLCLSQDNKEILKNFSHEFF